MTFDVEVTTGRRLTRARAEGFDAQRAVVTRNVAVGPRREVPWSGTAGR